MEKQNRRTALLYIAGFLAMLTGCKPKPKATGFVTMTTEDHGKIQLDLREDGVVTWKKIG